MTFPVGWSGLVWNLPRLLSRRDLWGFNRSLQSQSLQLPTPFCDCPYGYLVCPWCRSCRGTLELSHQCGWDRNQDLKNLQSTVELSKTAIQCRKYTLSETFPKRTLQVKWRPCTFALYNRKMGRSSVRSWIGAVLLLTMCPRYLPINIDNNDNSRDFIADFGAISEKCQWSLL